MKKITLFFAALAVALSVNAQVTFGVYSETCGFIPSGDDKIGGAPGEGIFPRVNPSNMTFALQVDNMILANILADPSLTLAFANMRIGDDVNSALPLVLENGAAVRFTRAPGDELIFYVKNFDAMGSGSVYSDGIAVGDIRTITSAADNISAGVGHLHTQLLVASIDPDDGFWWDESAAAGWNPAIRYKYLGQYDVNAPVLTQADLLTILGASECADSGLSDNFADKGEPIATQLYSITGIALPSTAKGLVLAKYTFADGSVDYNKEIRK